MAPKDRYVLGHVTSLNGVYLSRFKTTFLNLPVLYIPWHRQAQTQTTLFTFIKSAKIQTATYVSTYLPITYTLLNLSECCSDLSVFYTYLQVRCPMKRVIPLSNRNI